VNLDSFGLTSRVLELIKNNQRSDKYTSRSEVDQAVITALVKKGATNDQVRLIFQTYEIGQKYREKGPYRDRYLKHSINKAKAFLKAQHAKGG